MRFIKAVKIFDGAHFLPGSPVLVYKDGKLMEITKEDAVSAGKVEHFDGILTPGFVNAHCHLELSHLKGKLARGAGFCDFALSLMGRRSEDALQLRHAAMQQAAEEMRRNGIVAVGDISNTNESFGIKRDYRPLYFHTFIELIALNPAHAGRVFSDGVALLHNLESAGLAGSLAPHAPYSVSDDLFQRIASYDRDAGTPLSIHCQETIEETRFLMGESCGIHELYKQLGIDISFYRAPRASTVDHLLPLLGGTGAILVHNTFAGSGDVERAALENVTWCFCPRANLFIEGRLPEFSHFRSHARRLCVGTDSLASNDALDVLAELNEIARAAPFFSDEQLLAMITSNGADALGIADRFGHLAPGTTGGLNLLRRDGSKFELVRTVL